MASRHAGAGPPSVLDDLGEEITGIAAPVSICMAIVVLLVKLLNPDGTSETGNVFIATLAYAEQGDDTAGQKLGGALLNAVIFVGIVAAMTFVLFFLFKYRCYKAIYAYMGFAVFDMFFVLTGGVLLRALQVLGIHVDAFSLCFMLFNFSIVGVVGLFFGPIPLFMKQAYLVWTGVVTAFLFTYVPEWTSWVLLALMAIYDLVAVLAPGGPLKVLVELAIERDQELPALVYEARPSGGRPYHRGWRRDGAGEGEGGGGGPDGGPGGGGVAAGGGGGSERGEAAEPGGSPSHRVALLAPGRPRSDDDAPRPSGGGGGSGGGGAWMAAAGGGGGGGALALSTDGSQMALGAVVAAGADGAAGDAAARGARPRGGRSSGAGGGARLAAAAAANAAAAGGGAAPPAPAGAPAAFVSVEEEEGVELPDAIKLGLGDFIFYSMLVGRASMYDMMTVYASFLAIIAGLGITLLLLALARKALPALPVSIALGAVFYFATRFVLEPFAVPLVMNLALRCGPPQGCSGARARCAAVPPPRALAGEGAPAASGGAGGGGAAADKYGWEFDRAAQKPKKEDPRIQDVPVALIRRPLGRTRANDQEKVAALMHSITEIGLQEPIDVLLVEGVYYGFSGCHRSAAPALTYPNMFAPPSPAPSAAPAAGPLQARCAAVAARLTARSKESRSCPRSCRPLNRPPPLVLCQTGLRRTSGWGCPPSAAACARPTGRSCACT
ncbi:MAG: Presenilin-domain-containing protein [Monoraphidium minutum]|nr:MAG: Presenilin-domain-containing protein [Monoraphidium minutum]